MNGTIENSDNNFNQPTEANSGAADTETSPGDKSDTDVETNPGGFLTVKSDENSLNDIEKPVSEAESPFGVEEKSKDEPLIFDNSVKKPIFSPESEPKADSTEFKEAEKQEELSESEKEMLQIMEALLEKYPHAFVEETDETGRQYLHFKGISSGVENTNEKITHNSDNDSKEGYIYFCKEGIIRVDKGSYEQLKIINRDIGSKIVDDFFFPDGHPNTMRMAPEGSQKGDRHIAIFGLRSTHVDLSSLKDDFSKYEELHKDDVDVVEPKELTTEEIINSL